MIDDETGFLVHPQNPVDLAEKVSILLQNPQKALQLGKNGRAMVEQRWSVDAMVQGYEKLITSIYESKSEAPFALASSESDRKTQDDVAYVNANG